MRKNYSDLICDKANRTLTAKAGKFQWRCIELIAKQRNLYYCRYSPEIRVLKNSFNDIFTHLVIDKELSLREIKEIIKSSDFIKKLCN